MSASAPLAIAPHRARSGEPPGVLAAAAPSPTPLVVALLAAPGCAAAAEVVARRLMAAASVRAVVRYTLSSASDAACDPYRLRRIVPGLGADAVLMVAPTPWGPRRLLPAPSIEGCPVALVQAERAADLPRERGGPDPSAPWIVAAMAKDIFLQPTEQWARTLCAGGRVAVDLRADRARRSDLIHALHAGPEVVLYAGHGRTRGWGGYQALRSEHLASGQEAAARAAGLIVAIACSTLSRSRRRVPFGTRVVASGVARAYLGAAAPIQIVDAEALAEIILDRLARGDDRTVAALIRGIECAAATRPAARRAWKQFRLIGDPSTPLSPRGDRSPGDPLPIP